MIGLPDKIVALHLSMKEKGIPHAFGGALALAWCTERARGTIDIDLNVFVASDQAEAALQAMPDNITWSAKDIEVLHRDGQARIWWSETPIDIFLNTLKLHEQMARRARWETFSGESLPFLSCVDIAVLKVFFNRTKDWADLEEMYRARTLNVSQVTATIIEYLGADDERVKKLSALKPDVAGDHSEKRQAPDRSGT